MELCSHLAAKGCEIDVLTSKGYGHQKLPDRVQVHDWMQRWSWQELPRLIKFFRQVRPDAVFLYYIGFVYDDHRMITFAPTVSRFVLGSYLLKLFAPFEVRERRYIYGSEFGAQLKTGFGTGCCHLRAPG
jgi:hypothetical protein